MANDDDDVSYYFKDGKLHFTADGLRLFTKEERNRLVELHEQRAKKFDEICEYLAKQLGYDNPATLSAELKAQLADEAEELTETWDSEVEMSEDPQIAEKSFHPEPGLQTLLAACQELGERILDIQDEAVSRDDERD
jgi:hypothetical protein